MVFLQVIAAFQALFIVIGIPGNLLVILTIALERRFHLMRYILLASLAVSDVLFLVFVNSFRTASIAQERWLYGETMCYLNPSLARYFYVNTLLHLIAVSYERYKAIVKSPLTYEGAITKSRIVFIALIWIIPIPLSVGPFIGYGKYVYNPDVFFCEQGWAVQRDIITLNATFFVVTTLALPFLMLAFLNWSVYKTAKSQINAIEGQIGNLAGSENQQRELTRRIRERNAAFDVIVIIAAFLLCFLPFWVVGFCLRLKSGKVPAEAQLVTNCIFFASALCNPIIYSIRKRDFRDGVKKLLRWIGLCRSSVNIDNNVTCMNNLRLGANSSSDVKVSTSTAAAAVISHYLDERYHRNLQRSIRNFPRCLSPIPEIAEVVN